MEAAIRREQEQQEFIRQKEEEILKLQVKTSLTHTSLSYSQ